MKQGSKKLAVFGLFLGLGCTSSSKPDMEICHADCKPDEDVWICKDSDKAGDRVCAGNITDAYNLCGGGDAEAFKYLECEGNEYADGGSGGPEEGSEGESDQRPEWMPGQYVKPGIGADSFVIDAALIYELSADSSVLLVEDKARLVELPRGFFALRSVAKDDLAYHLGLRGDDIILAVNGQPLRTLDDYLTAIVKLHGSTQLQLKIRRGGTNGGVKVLTYSIE